MIFALPFGLGCALCQYVLPEPWRYWTAGIAVLALLLSSLLRGRQRSVVRIAAGGLAAGVLWFSGFAALCLDPAQALTGREDWVEVRLLDYPAETDYGARCPVEVPGLRGKALLYGGAELLDLEPGNRVGLAVRHESAAAPGGEESSYFTSRGIFLRLYGQGELEVEAGDAGSLRYLPQRLARRMKAAAAARYDQPERGLVTALLTGERDGLDRQSLSDLTRSGLMHVTAVSGLHCGFLIALLGVLVFRRQRLTALLGYPVLLLYAAMTGCTPSVVRACVMMGFVLLAPLLGREGDGPTSLSGALLVILLANPFAIASVSLQLSFAAVAGLLWLGPRIYSSLEPCGPKRGGLVKKLWLFLAGTLSASLGVLILTAPLSAVYFGFLALASPLSNLLVLWMAPALFACALLGTVLPPLAALAAPMARYLLWAAGLTAGLPGVRFAGPEAVMWLLLAYTLLGICALSRDRRRKYAFALCALAVSLAAVKALPRAVVGGDLLTAVAVDVGQGAGTLLHSGGRTALVDCGSLSSPQGAGDAAADAMDAYGWDRLDYAALTHYHADHAGGLAGLLARVEVGELLLPRLPEGGDQGALQREVLSLAERYGVPVRWVEEPAGIALGEALLTVYPPAAAGDANEEGLTVLCTAGEFDLLITGDMNAATERVLTETYDLPDIEVLLAGHHGSKSSPSRELLEAVWPEVGVVSVGENRFGHPAPEAMERMAAAGMELYRTDWQGNILIRVHKSPGGAQ